MAVRVCINGFGRIGRLVLRALFEGGRDDIEVVAINDLAPQATNAHLLKYDSVHGRFGGEVSVDGNDLIVNGKRIKGFQETDPAKLPWGDLGIDVAMECSGRFTKRDDAAKHLLAGAKKVLISAPATDEDLTVVYGVNHNELKASHVIVSNASCTTNCLAPVAFVLNNAVGIEHGFMTTIHSYTNDQRILDLPNRDLRRARSAALSQIPTTTGAAKAVGKIIPDLKGKLDGISVRVPTPTGSLVDLVVVIKKTATKEEINAAVKKAAEGPMKGVLEYTEDEIVSVDVIHNPASSIFDAQSTMVNGKMIKVLSWYDNEWGYSARCVDLIEIMGKML